MPRRVPLPLPTLAFLILACNGSAASQDTNDSPPEQDASDAATSLTLSPSPTITLAPGSSTEVIASVEPKDAYTVRFWLLGESLDASLDASIRITSSNGTASVNLLASTSPTAFRLKATAGGSASAEVSVAVSSRGYANARVSPLYKGIRSTPTWTASAIVGSTCTEIPGQPPQDGPIVSVENEHDPVELHSLPVGPPIAITLRSEQSVGGCTELTDLSPDETRDVSVKVSDMPVQVSDIDLNLLMTLDSEDTTMMPMLDEVAKSFVETVFPPRATEATTFLDAVLALVPDSDVFASLRTAYGWDEIVSTWIRQENKTIAERMLTWIERGLQPLGDGELLVGGLTALSGSSNQGVLSLVRFGGLPYLTTGVSQEHSVSLSVEPGDTTLIGGKIAWQPTRLIGAAGDAGAQQIESSPNAALALASIFGCAQITTLLFPNDRAPSACDDLCFESACENALASLWNESINSDEASSDIVQTSFSISGTATVDGNATIAGLNATWVGTQTRSDTETPIKGSAVGSIEPSVPNHKSP